ncbi:hypothetical protein Aperf_G00000012015 [Anoplocephala perfoliata]
MALNENVKELQKTSKALAIEIASLNAQLNNVKLHAEFESTVKSNLKAENEKTGKYIRHLKAEKAFDKEEAKLATSCVNTQYKLLQRLFLLRVHEFKEAITKLRNENLELKSEYKRMLQMKNELIAEKDEKINRLETHAQSLHFQLERVVLEMVEKLGSRLDQDRIEWEKMAYDIHQAPIEIMRKLGFSHFMT